MITDEKLEELRVLCDMADKGPWYAWTSPGGIEMVNTGMDRAPTINMNYNRKGGKAVANADFIVAARTAMPELIRELQIVRAILASRPRQGTP